MKIKSKFIAEIIDLLLDQLEDEGILRNQYQYLIDTYCDYTGSGVFVDFEFYDKESVIPTREKEQILEGVEIISPDIPLGADATLFIKNGYINFLEIWSHGDIYPKRDLDKYQLRQKWNNNPGREIKSINW